MSVRIPVIVAMLVGWAMASSPASAAAQSAPVSTGTVWAGGSAYLTMALAAPADECQLVATAGARTLPLSTVRPTEKRIAWVWQVPAALPPLVQSYASSTIGASGQLPTGWTAVRGPGFLRLASRDGTSQIALISQPSVPGRRLPLLRAALASIRKTYGAITVKHGRGTSLGGLPARSVVLYTHNKAKVPIRILVAAAQGQHLAYVLEAFNAQRAPERDLVETQQIVIALRLAG